MDKVLPALLAVVGGIITVAIVSVLVSRNSQTSEALGAAGGFLSRVISAAVSPVATAATNGNPSNNAFGMPALPNIGTFGGGPGGVLNLFPNVGGFA